jgi:hypothetical protein
MNGQVREGSYIKLWSTKKVNSQAPATLLSHWREPMRVVAVFACEVIVEPLRTLQKYPEAGINFSIPNECVTTSTELYNRCYR